MENIEYGFHGHIGDGALRVVPIIDFEDKNKAMEKVIVLMNKVFDLIKEKHPHSKLTLTVNRQNYKAINFYFKLGFKIQTVADFDIGNGYVMNDFVMFYES